MRTGQRGFTLVEILVATAIFAIFMVGMLNLLDTSTKFTQLETSLADTQENVRFAAYHIMRTARMIGGGGMPFAGTSGASDRWVSGELVSNVNGTVAVPGYGAVNAKPHSDVLTLRGFFEISPFFTDPTKVLSGTNSVSIYQFNGLNQPINDIDSLSTSGLEGRGLVFMGGGSYCVGRIAAGASVTGEGQQRRLVMDHTAGEAPWADLNTGSSYPPGFQVYRVGILDSYTYFVDSQNVLRRIRVAGGSVDAEPVAVNIGDLQIMLGVDTTGDGFADTWNDNPNTASDIAGNRVISMRVAVLGRSSYTVPDWVEPESTFRIFDGTEAGKERSAKWRSIMVEVNLRNYKF